MNNIVQRLATFFPLDKDEDHLPSSPRVPKFPPLPSPEPAKDNTTVFARATTVDRAVSARRLTTDRAVSVASGLHFDDDLSGKWRAKRFE